MNDRNRPKAAPVSRRKRSTRLGRTQHGGSVFGLQEFRAMLEAELLRADPELSAAIVRELADLEFQILLLEDASQETAAQ